MIERQKVLAYITQGTRLLVFTHPDSPEAGLQVPAGTVEPNEQPEAAALREAREETNLTALKLVRPLGFQRRDMSDFGKDEIHYRSFYHFLCQEETPSTWDHGEKYPYDEPGEHPSFRHIFRFYWHDLSNGLPSLIGDHDYCLPQLLQNLDLQS